MQKRQEKISSKQAIELEARYGAHNYHPLPVVLEKGEGIFLYTLEGERYMDFLAGYGAVNQGHCHPRIVRACVEQAQKLTLTSRAFHSNWLGLAEKALCEFFDYEMSLLMNSGAEANETAIKLVRKWAYQKKGIDPDQAIIVACHGNFHGRTLGVISAATDALTRTDFGPFLPGYQIIPYGDIEALRASLKNPNVAGVWFEPIQGEAGVIFPPKGFLAEASVACQNANVLLMADEVQSGIGRAGKKLACDWEGVRPDVLILGKSLSGGMMPISAVLADTKIMEVFKPGEHGSTFGGNPLASRILIEALAVVEDEKLCENSLVQGERLRKALAPLTTHTWIKEVRGIGLFNAIEMKKDSPVDAYEVCLRLMKKGLLAKPTHETTIRLTPPLVIGAEQIETAARWIHEVFQTVV